MNILVSACLLGVCCRYDGKAQPCEDVIRLMDKHTLIPVCPEQLGGLPTPRKPAQRRAQRVIDADAQDVTVQFLAGASEVVRLAKLYGVECAVLKSKSPSCGEGQIYDGTFTGALIPGDGVTAQALKAAGIRVLNEKDVSSLT
ncbi:MAG: DUF523 domain-containing protein [Clostridia bacterium]|nr:DUF523 domain-containing protein [Clostridia bacterium]